MRLNRKQAFEWLVRALFTAAFVSGAIGTGQGFRDGHLAGKRTRLPVLHRVGDLSPAARLAVVETAEHPRPVTSGCHCLIDSVFLGQPG